MSDEDQIRSGRDCDGDVAAYALGALEPAEAEAFRAHLETCSACRDDLAAFQPVVDTLPLSAPAHCAPAGLRRRVLAEVDASASAPASARTAPEPERPSWRRWIAAGGWRPALAVAAVVAVAVVVVLRLEAGSAPSYRQYRAQVTGPGAARLGVRSGRGELVVDGFAAPPRGDIYEVWVKHGDRPPQPTTALFGVTRAGSANVAVPGTLRHGTTVMVTPEPQGGSRVPTHSPVLIVSIT
jgi:anti-sigma-K factor RskA